MLMACVGALWFGAFGAGQENRLGLPPEFAGYRQWSQLLKSPYQVPMELWVLCRAPATVDWAAAREKYGPHTERFIRVYGNAEAVAAVSDPARRPFPRERRSLRKSSPHRRTAHRKA